MSPVNCTAAASVLFDAESIMREISDAESRPDSTNHTSEQITGRMN